MYTVQLYDHSESGIVWNWNNLNNMGFVLRATLLHKSNQSLQSLLELIIQQQNNKPQQE